jgi:hypothetical protein
MEAPSSPDRITPDLRLGSELIAELRRLVAMASDIWSKPGLQHPHFTHHGLAHSDSIRKKLGVWLERASLRLHEHEIFVLLAAVYLHDIGMQCRNVRFWADFAGLRGEGVPLSQTGLRAVRQNHARLSYEMIRDACRGPADRRYPELGLDCSGHTDLYNAVALLALGHVGAPNQLPQEITANYALNSGGANLLLLQHLLRIGDALDATQSRINHDYASRAWTAFSPFDKYHTLKHQYVVAIDMSESGVFRFLYEIPTSERSHYDLVRSCVEHNLSAQLAEAGPLLRRLGVPVHTVDGELLSRDPAHPYAMDSNTFQVFCAEARRVQQPDPAHPRPPSVALPFLAEGDSVSDGPVSTSTASVHQQITGAAGNHVQIANASNVVIDFSKPPRTR